MPDEKAETGDANETGDGPIHERIQEEATDFENEPLEIDISGEEFEKK